MNGLTCKAHCIGVYLRKSQRTNKQSKFPRFAPPTRGNPWGQDEEAYLRTKTDLTEVNFPSGLIFYSTTSVFFGSKELSGIRFGQIGWEGVTHPIQRYQVSGCTSPHLLPTLIDCQAGKTCDKTERGFYGPSVMCRNLLCGTAGALVVIINSNKYLLWRSLRTSTHRITPTFIHGWKNTFKSSRPRGRRQPWCPLGRWMEFLFIQNNIKKILKNTPNIYMLKDYRKVPFPKEIFARYGEEKAIQYLSIILFQYYSWKYIYWNSCRTWRWEGSHWVLQYLLETASLVATLQLIGRPLLHNLNTVLEHIPKQITS